LQLSDVVHDILIAYCYAVIGCSVKKVGCVFDYLCKQLVQMKTGQNAATFHGDLRGNVF